MEASVKCFAVYKTYLLSAGSKMQAHLHEFKGQHLIPLHKFSQKVFEQQKNNGLRDLQVAALDFRIMACVLTSSNAVLGTSSGHLIVCNL